MLLSEELSAVVQEIAARIKALFDRGASKSGDILYSADAPGPDWLPCDGSAYLQSSYPALYGKLGNIPTSNIGDLVPQAMPTSNWSAVTFGNGLFVALVAGSSLYCYTSTDGLTWTKRSMGANVSWVAVTYGNGVFVAIASGTTTMATSPDGINWTTHVMPVSTSWKLLAFGNGVFVAMANNTSIAATSPDGVTWTQRAIAGSANWYAMTYGNGLFVVVTFGNLVSATSPDGVTWTLGSKLPLSGSWSGIAYGNGVFVATGSVGMAISTDGINWTGFPTPYMSSAYTVVFCNGYFAAFGTGYLSITSEDGSHWSKHILPASIVANCSAAGAGVIIALSNSAQLYGVSPDGPRYSYDTGTQFVVPDIDALDGRISQLKAYVRT